LKTSEFEAFRTGRERIKSFKERLTGISISTEHQHGIYTSAKDTSVSWFSQEVKDTFFLEMYKAVKQANLEM